MFRYLVLIIIIIVHLTVAVLQVKTCLICVAKITDLLSKCLILLIVLCLHLIVFVNTLTIVNMKLKFANTCSVYVP